MKIHKIQKMIKDRRMNDYYIECTCGWKYWTSVEEKLMREYHRHLLVARGVVV